MEDSSLQIDRRIAEVYRNHNRRSPFLLGNPVETRAFTQPELFTDFFHEFKAEEGQLGRHMAVLGVSGAGKSKFLELFCRHLIETGNGFTFIDPHGDTAESVVDYVANQTINSENESLFSRFHYLKPDDQDLFSFNPLSIRTNDPQNSFAVETARDTAVDKLVRVILRSEAQDDEEKMRRLKRWLKNALTIIATPLPDGRQLSFGDLPAVLYPHHKHHKAIVQRLRGELPLMVENDFRFLEEISRRQVDVDRYIESTLNRITDVCSTMTRAIFGRQAPGFDFSDAIRNRHCTVVNLQETTSISREAGGPIADFIINEIRNICAEFEERGERTRHYLIIDEASNYMADDLGQFLDQARKWQLSICLGAQHLSNFRKGTVDISDKVLGHCKTVISFQQRNLFDVEQLGKYFSYPNLVLRERMQVMDRPDPSADELVTLSGTSSTRSETGTRSTANAKGSSSGKGIQITRSRGEGEGTSKSTGESRNVFQSNSVGQGSGYSDGQQTSSGTGSSASPIVLDGQILQYPTRMEQDGKSAFSGYSNSDFESASKGTGYATNQSEATSTSRNRSESQGISFTDAESFLKTLTEAISRGFSQTNSTNQTILQRTQEFWYGTGDARYALPYQYAMHEFLLTTLPDQYAFIRSRVSGVEQSSLFRVANVDDCFETESEARKTRKAFLTRLFSNRKYMFKPRAPDEVLEERVAWFSERDQSPRDTGRDGGFTL